MRTHALFIAAALLAAPPLSAQTATPEEIQNPLLVLQHLPKTPTHDKIQVRHYDFKEFGGPMEYQLFVPSKYDAAKQTPLARTPENMKKVFDFFDAHPKN